MEGCGIRDELNGFAEKADFEFRCVCQFRHSGANLTITDLHLGPKTKAPTRQRRI